ncbi:50S ribosomal protein L4 [Candidatus Woesearchaeota archaeon]|nr:50S ribosomal protein L4 [Candidatus Woesearchaeota archaeon]
MELKVLGLDGSEAGKVKLPEQFGESFRPDIIKRAVEAIWSHTRQPYGADPRAGKRYSSKLSKRRRKSRGSYGKGISRVQRKVVSRRGIQLNLVGAFVPGTVGGRKAHPAKAEKVWTRKINDKERRLAIRSAIAATVDKALVEKRGHKVPAKYPFIIDNSIEAAKKTKDVKNALLALGFKEELERASVKHVRAGRGGSRGRKNKKAKGPLFVVSKECEGVKALKNIAGIDVVEVSRINAELLAPGCHAGRLTIFTKDAVEQLGKQRLFV